VGFTTGIPGEPSFFGGVGRTLKVLPVSVQKNFYQSETPNFKMLVEPHAAIYTYVSERKEGDTSKPSFFIWFFKLPVGM
jgi:hypothetical protein